MRMRMMRMMMMMMMMKENGGDQGLAPTKGRFVKPGWLLFYTSKF